MIYVRVSEYEFVGKLVAHVGNVKLSFLVANLRIEANMEQHVAKLFADVRCVVLHQGICKLVSLLYGVWSQALVGLLPVPWTFLAKSVQNVNQSAKSRHFFFSRMHNIKNFVQI